MAEWDTSPSLLNALRQGDANSAWERFYDQYAGAVYRYLLKLGLRAHQAEDVLQETMVQMVKILPEFIYDPTRRFRNFLLTVAHRKALYAMRKERVRGEAFERAADDPTQPLRPGKRSSGEVDRQKWKQALLETAWAELKEATATGTQTLAIFEALVFEEKPVQQIATEFQITPNSIYQVKNRLMRQLQRRVRQMQIDLE